MFRHVATARLASKIGVLRGAPPGHPHCEDVGCLMGMVRERERCLRITHAEINALRYDDGTADAIYTTGQPCYDCLKEITCHPNIKLVMWSDVYPDSHRDRVMNDLPDDYLIIQQLPLTPLLERLRHELG